MIKVAWIALALLFVTQAPVQSANAVSSVVTGLATFAQALDEEPPSTRQGR